MITKFTIYGERCSGTNYIEQLIKLNFDITLTYEYGWKHFFGFDNNKFNTIPNTDNCLFICIVRDITKWINSLYKTPHHLESSMLKDTTTFLNSKVVSLSKNKTEIINDRNMYTNENYNNLLELRHTKLKYLIETLPTMVKNCIIIRYEDLLNDFENTMNKFKQFDIKMKDNIAFPLNTDIDYKHSGKYRVRNNNYISSDLILNHHSFNPYYEQKLGYL
jgi:hypothetical protein